LADTNDEGVDPEEAEHIVEEGGVSLVVPSHDSEEWHATFFDRSWLRVANREDIEHSVEPSSGPESDNDV
jgi:hypothetical protein